MKRLLSLFKKKSSAEKNKKSETKKAKKNTSTVAFKNFDLNPVILNNLKDRGYTHPTPIQEKAIPLLLKGHDLMGLAQTGTGKTAAFALPLLTKADGTLTKPQILVLAPTRELAIQVSNSFVAYAKGLNIDCVTIYGGAPIEKQRTLLQNKPHVIVGTPGRIIDFIRQGDLDLSEIKAVVLDEADEMLRMGFIEEVTYILYQLPKERQTICFSATLPDPIKEIAHDYMTHPKEVVVKSSEKTALTIAQYYCEVASRRLKPEALDRLLHVHETESVIIFAETKNMCAELGEFLKQQQWNAAVITGDVPQKKRESIMNQFRHGRIQIMVATDVAARGLDIDNVSHVINYDLPTEPETYVHRIGRTGRAGEKGDAISLVTKLDQDMLKQIQEFTQKDIQLLPLPTEQELAQVKAKKLVNAFKEKGRKDETTFHKHVVEELKSAFKWDDHHLASVCLRLYMDLIQEKQTETPRHSDHRDQRRHGRHNSRPSSNRSGANRSRPKPSRSNSHHHSEKTEPTPGKTA